MTIEIDNILHDFKDFLFKKVILTEEFASSCFASEFLTKWISGGKEFEMQTSGTTGVPKKIILKRKWLETSALQTIHLLNLWDEKIYCCISTNKIGGLMMIVRALAGGFDIKIVEPEADPMKIISEDHDFTFISLVPYQLTKILEDESSSIKLNRFRNILLGGSDVSVDLNKRIQKLSPIVYHTYGMTETCSHVALKKLNHDGWEHFKPNPEIELDVNQEGLLSVRGFQTGNDWVHTSDIIKLNGDGTFEFIGRADFVINTGSYKIYPEFLEQKIHEIFHSEGFNIPLAVSSKKHKEWGEEVILVISDMLISEEEILALLKRRLINYELPKSVLNLASIPLNEGGKIDRKKLQTLLTDEL